MSQHTAKGLCNMSRFFAAFTLHWPLVYKNSAFPGCL